MTTQEVYLLDTNIASIAWDQAHYAHASIRRRLEALAPSEIVISCVTNAEIEFGLRSAPFIDEEKQQVVRENMSSYYPFRLDHHTAEQYGQIRAALFKKYWQPYHSKNTKYIEDLVDEITGKSLGIQENDLWIVSVALQYRFIFITGDKAGGMKRVVEAASYQHRTQYWPLN
jgi:predicted nucleic acid-binding protein